MKVRYRKRALDDIDDIYLWRSRFNDEVATKIEAARQSCAEWLGEHPEIGTRTDEPNVRRWSMPDFHYAIFYLVDPDANILDILRVIDGRRMRDIKRLP